MEFIGNGVSVYTHLSSFGHLLTCFSRIFSFTDAYFIFTVGLWFKYVTTLIWRKQQLYVLHAATLVSPSPSLVTREYLVAPFNQPAVWRGLKQRIQQEHLKKKHTKQVAGRWEAVGN